MPEAPYVINKFLAQNIKYPVAASFNNIEGSVIVQFIVNEDGSITDVKQVGNKAGVGMDEEAVRVVKLLPKWKPGRIHHCPVKVYFTLPVSFKLL